MRPVLIALVRKDLHETSAHTLGARYCPQCLQGCHRTAAMTTLQEPPRDWPVAGAVCHYCPDSMMRSQVQWFTNCCSSRRRIKSFPARGLFSRSPGWQARSGAHAQATGTATSHDIPFGYIQSNTKQLRLAVWLGTNC
jgi:hypothetical protein